MFNTNKDENAHRYAVSGKKKVEKERWRERESEWERDRDREKKEIWKLWNDLKVLTIGETNLVTAFLKHDSDSDI